MIVYTAPHYRLKNFSFSVKIGTSILNIYIILGDLGRYTIYGVQQAIKKER
ncbi:MAG: hypothetical protein RLZZ115_1913 [Cyanobacteriota bacterium]|jgi:hypothetical protein|nr:hypothetical protein PRNO82_01586 [Planktothrix rubescens]